MFLILFNLNGVPWFGTISKGRMEQFQFGILIDALVGNSGGQWSTFSGMPFGKKLGKKSVFCFFLKHNSPSFESRALSSFSTIFRTIPRNNKYTKNPRIWSPWIFSIRDHRTNIKANGQCKYITKKKINVLDGYNSHRQSQLVGQWFVVPSQMQEAFSHHNVEVT